MLVNKIFGGAGTGKTSMLINLLKQHLKNGYTYDDIGFFSFSQAAIKEVKIRASIPQNAKFFRTLHSVAYYGTGSNSNNIYIPSKRKHINVDFEKLYNYIKSSKCDYSVAQKKLHTTLTFSQYQAIKNNREKYFLENSFYDFNDIVYKFIKTNIFPRFKILFIDEGQDLVPILWELVDKLVDNTSDFVYIAGDDDQTIYSFAGAQAKDFINFHEDKRIILDKNYRNPKNHFKLAYKQLNPIKNRVDKNIITTKEDSFLKKIPDFDNFYLPYNSKKTTAFLFRNIIDCITFEEYLWLLGRNFINKEGIVASKLRKAKNFKQNQEYPNIYVSTIHRMKGREFDNVVYYHKDLDIEHNKEDECRVIYVALTRSKNKLTIIDEQNTFKLN